MLLLLQSYLDKKEFVSNPHYFPLFLLSKQNLLYFLAVVVLKKNDPNAKKYTEVTFEEVLSKNLKVMDSTAASLCRDNNMPTMIFALGNGENIISAVSGENIGTIVNN